MKRLFQCQKDTLHVIYVSMSNYGQIVCIWFQYEWSTTVCTSCSVLQNYWMGNWIKCWFTWVNVVRCLRLAGVGQDAVVGVCPACWGNDEIPLPGDETPPDNDDKPEFGSGFNFLNAPSAGQWMQHILKWRKKKQIYSLLILWWCYSHVHMNTL